MFLDPLDNIDSGGRYAGDELEVLSLDVNDRSGIEINITEDSSRICIRSRHKEVEVVLDSDDRLEELEQTPSRL